MDFGDSSFDVVLCGFVGWSDVFDFARCEYTERDKKIEEIFRVLKEGGHVGISTWALQEDNEWMGTLLNRYLPGQAPRWRYSKETVAGLEKILRSAGFKNVEVVTEEREFTYQDEGEWLAVMRDYGWRVHLEKLQDLSPDKRQEFDRDVLKELGRRKQADGIHYTRTVLFALGTR